MNSYAYFLEAQYYCPRFIFRITNRASIWQKLTKYAKEKSKKNGKDDDGRTRPVYSDIE